MGQVGELGLLSLGPGTSEFLSLHVVREHLLWCPDCSWMQRHISGLPGRGSYSNGNNYRTFSPLSLENVPVQSHKSVPSVFRSLLNVCHSCITYKTCRQRRLLPGRACGPGPSPGCFLLPLCSGGLLASPDWSILTCGNASSAQNPRLPGCSPVGFLRVALLGWELPGGGSPGTLHACCQPGHCRRAAQRRLVGTQ